MSEAHPRTRGLLLTGIALLVVVCLHAATIVAPS